MIEDIRHKVRQLYLFLKEANQLRFPPVRNLSSASEGDSARRCARARVRADQSPSSTAKARALRTIACCASAGPTSSSCPPPPFNVSHWLLPDWDDPDARRHISRRAATPRAPKARRSPSASTTMRSAWRTSRPGPRSGISGPRRSSRPARRCGFFELFYEIHAAIERDGEQLELVAGDGRLNWRAVSSHRRRGADRSSRSCSSASSCASTPAPPSSASMRPTADGALQRAVRGPAEHRRRLAAQSHGGAGKRGLPSVGRRGHGKLPESRGADAVAHQRPAARRKALPTSRRMRRACGATRC